MSESPLDLIASAIFWVALYEVSYVISKKMCTNTKLCVFGTLTVAALLYFVWKHQRNEKVMTLRPGKKQT
jgi:hypothetical protein